MIDQGSQAIQIAPFRQFIKIIMPPKRKRTLGRKYKRSYSKKKTTRSIPSKDENSGAEESECLGLLACPSDNNELPVLRDRTEFATSQQEASSQEEVEHVLEELMREESDPLFNPKDHRITIAWMFENSSRGRSGVMPSIQDALNIKKKSVDIA
jgi:uncharacterized protein YbaR (Trm112 family)